MTAVLQQPTDPLHQSLLIRQLALTTTTNLVRATSGGLRLAESALVDAAACDHRSGLLRPTTPSFLCHMLDSRLITCVSCWSRLELRLIDGMTWSNLNLSLLPRLSREQEIPETPIFAELFRHASLDPVEAIPFSYSVGSKYTRPSRVPVFPARYDEME